MAARDKKAEKFRENVTGKVFPGLGNLVDVLGGKVKPGSGRNKKGVHVGTKKERERVRHRLELKYPNSYPGGGKDKKKRK